MAHTNKISSREELLEKIEKLEAQIEGYKESQKRSTKSKLFLTEKVGSFLILGPALKKNVKKLLEGDVSKDNTAEILVNILYRFTRIGIFAIVTVLVPIFLLFQQNRLLSRQNEKIDKQNDLFFKQDSLIILQNNRLDQQTSLLEAERRSAVILESGNVLDAISRELLQNKDGSLSDPLIGRVIALSRAMKEYKYLDPEADTLIGKALSPERGHLLVSLYNSNLHPNTNSKINVGASFQKAGLSRASLKYADLKEAYLQGADLKEAILKNTLLNKANLAKANLQEANLDNSTLEEAKLMGANLWKASLKGSNLSYANLSGANLKFADLKKADLSYAEFNDAELDSTDLSFANLTGASLRGVDLNSTILKNSNLSKADLRYIRLWGVFLRGALLKQADMRSSILNYLELSHADLRGVNFEDADLTGTELIYANLEGANLKNTILTGVKNLSYKRIVKVSCLYMSKGLDPSLVNKLKKTKPCLFQKDGCP